MTGDLQTLIRSRRSIRQYTGGEVPREVVQRVLEAAIWAPSAHNRQPWRFAVLRSAAIKATLARLMGAQLRSDRLSDGDPAAVVEADVNRSFTRITGGPVVVVVCLSMRDMDKYPDPRRQAAEHVMAIQGTAMAAQNLMLAAAAEGLGACWLCAPLFAPQAVQDSLGLPYDWEPQGLLTLGYPVGEPKLKSRQPADSVVLWR